MNKSIFKQKIKKMSKPIFFTFHFSLFFFMLMLIGCGGCGGVKRDTVSIPNENIIQSPKTMPDYEKDSISKQNYQELKLTPIDRKKVLDHYVYYTRDTTFRDKGEHSIYLFNGKEEKKIKVDNDYEITITPNEKYFTLSKLVEKSKNKFEFEVELRDFNNEILAKGNIPASFNDYYDEFKDAIYPMEDGSGFLQEGRRLDDALLFSVYKIRGNKFYKKFLYDKTTNLDYDKRSFNYGIKMNESGSEFLLLRKSGNHYFEFLNSEGKLIWSKEFPDNGKEYYIDQNFESVYKQGNSNKLFFHKYLNNRTELSSLGYDKKGNTIFKHNEILVKGFSIQNSIINAITESNSVIIINNNHIDTLLTNELDKLNFYNDIKGCIRYKDQYYIGLRSNLLMVYNYKSKTEVLYKVPTFCNNPTVINNNIFLKCKNKGIDEFNVVPYPTMYQSEINFDK